MCRITWADVFHMAWSIYLRSFSEYGYTECHVETLMIFRMNDAASKCFTPLDNLAGLAINNSKDVNILDSVAREGVPLTCRYGV